MEGPEGDRERIVQELRRLPGVAFATLLGSRASERARADADWDVAVCFDEAVATDEQARLRDELVAALEPRTRVDVLTQDLDQLERYAAALSRALRES